MKKQKAVFLFLIILCAIFLYICFFYGEEKKEIVFSVQPGFYEEAFDLEIYAPAGMEIYYTLDGSTPSENAIHYEGPVRIDDITDNPNIHSSRDDFVADMTDEFKAFGLESQFFVPDYNVDKCNVIRAVGIDKDGNSTEVKTANYFIGFEDRPGYDGLYVVTLNTDSSNFFDYENGIYVLGKTFDDCKVNGLNPDSTVWWAGNYRNKGPEWSRYTNVCIFKDGQELVNQDATVEIQGGSSRGVLPRGLCIKAEETDGSRTRFYGMDFENGYFPDAINLTAGGNRYLAKLNDYLVSNLTSDRAFATMNYHPCVVFIDGEYWGVYHMTEKYDRRFFADNYDMDKDEVIFVKGGALYEGTESDIEKYNDIFEFMTTADFYQPENYYELESRIDIQSLIDYYVVELYIARRNDWPIINEGMWCSRNVGRGEYADGRWRWALFDVNSKCLTAGLTEDDTLYRTRGSEKGLVINNLCNSPEFQRRFALSAMDIINTDFTTERTNAVIDEYIRLMQEPLEMSARRFSGGPRTDEIMTDIEEIRYFFNNRKDVFTKNLAQNFGLNTNLVALNLSINDMQGGYVHLNTIDVPFEDGEWSGDYYRNYPVTMTAYSYDGYHFVGWTGDVQSNEHTIEVPMDVEGEAVNIEAVFEKDSFFSEFE